MNAAPVIYRLEPHDPVGHRYRITLTVQQPDPQGQRLSLPAWIPGSYLIRDFSRQIETLSARAGTSPVAVVKTDNHSWQLAPCTGPVVIDYTVYAWDLSVRGAHLDESHGFFNGISVFLRVHGQDDQPCLLDLAPPPGIADWKVYTSLPQAGARRHGFGRYQAPDYDALIDHPVEMGTPQVARFTAHGAEHELVFTGVAPRLDLARIAGDVQKICETQIAFFEPRTRRAPFLDSASRYVFMTMITGDGYGGLEHRASTALMAARKDLPVLGQQGQGEGYRSFLGLVSHEYFHTWNVKRIKPAAFAPYHLQQPDLTRLLWIFEGFTSYYDDLLLLRCGLIGRTDYLGLLSKAITGVMRSPGRHKQSVAESSFDAWTRYYKQDENSPNALVSYYTKGSLVALGLDLLIRRQTQGQRSLDDVMRTLWQRYGRDFYRGRPQGLGEEEFPALVRDATGVDARRFIQRYAYGRADVPLAELLAPQGIAVRWKTASPIPSMDVRTRKQGDSLVLATVFEGGAAHRAGLSAGDVLVAIDGLKVEAASGLDVLLSQYRPGERVLVHVFRRDELRVYRLRLSAPQALDCVLSDAA
ncbi:peptidase M61 [Bordetella holmesii]|uniref:Peptidase, M61 glycyl aminopeptidase family protein n=2 Tax=Bordetella holmesii TaxID=35814 RepID=A0A158M6C5_9BORD|nr:peptidase M61 [Bordetella holmesii H558]AOB34312.1 peptidase M61 [Bordetella holmesii]KAK77748.1 peptidase, M61 glycyl aminopeptidase family protein [Bordetella holmesii CDC-H809-BH]KAK86891.1 peptidase, M61 glycyl aminopeptidase family protein [Bordetella holmesii CDC-H572-BH]KAK89305.1 peptidase, M61 glycyl aminopeptidase family protein [Bordetella holmesii CDC-H635-BH]KAK96054.1 peptidase, M61 glycyl aminopeptidase family protein [Bordetella holmesii CDC-H585-BH]KCV05634.1 peptidase, M6